MTDKSQQELKTTKSDNTKSRRLGRRELLARLSATGAVAVPAVWSKPIVESVVLPAHAQTTTEEGSGRNPASNSGSLNLFAMAPGFQKIMVEEQIARLDKARNLGILDGLVQPAHADPEVLSTISSVFYQAYIENRVDNARYYDFTIAIGAYFTDEFMGQLGNALEYGDEAQMACAGEILDQFDLLTGNGSTLFCLSGRLEPDVYNSLKIQTCSAGDTYIVNAKVDYERPGERTDVIMAIDGFEDRIVLYPGGNPLNCPSCGDIEDFAMDLINGGAEDLIDNCEELAAPVPLPPPPPPP